MTANANGTLLFEIRHADGGDNWITLGTLTPEDRDGSITDITGGGRDILLFRCDGGRSVLIRLVGALDVTAGPVRAVLLPPEGREILAVLGDGQSYERDVTSDALTEYRARWTHHGGG
jgi:hypothetical protein